MNIYEMYVLNDGVGFWVRRNTWGNSIARITHVAPLSTPAPYYGNPEVRVDLYNIHSKEIEQENMALSCAGTGQYVFINISGWEPSKPLKELTCPAPEPAFKKRFVKAQKDAEKREAARLKKRQENEAKPRLHFESTPKFMREKATLFERGCYVRWAPEHKLWWCLEEDLKTQKAVHELGCKLLPK